MTIQLTKSQLDQIKSVLAQVGLNVTVKKPSKRAAATELEARIAAIEAWKPETSAGRKCKANMLRWLRSPKTTEPNNTAAVLAIFGVRLHDVKPWPLGGPNQRAQMLANGTGKGLLAIPFLNANGNAPRCIVSDAAMLTTIHTTGGIGYGLRSPRQLNQA